MIWLVRHPPVALDWQKRCYGASDMGFSREGAQMAEELVAQIVDLSPDVIVHSDMKRTRTIAQRAACSLSISAYADHRWRERDFGNWEGLSWGAIYRRSGSAMDGMINDPNGFRPGGGETTAELVERSWDAGQNLPTQKTVVVITHGGPIAAILAHQDKADVSKLPSYIPAPGSIMKLDIQSV